MAVTVKKKKQLTLKTQRAPRVAKPGDEAAAASKASPRVAAPEAPAVKKPSYMFSGICGTLAFFVFVALLIFQYLEFDFYTKQGCWPAPLVPEGEYAAAPAEDSFAEVEPGSDESDFDDGSE